VLAGVLAACSSTPTGTLSLVTGGETDTFTKAPAPTQLVVEAVDTGGAKKELSRAALPTDRLDLGEQPQDTLAALRVTGVDGAGVTRVWGESLQFQYGALGDATLPLFVQRTGELARMPAPLASGAPDPALTLIAGRYVLSAHDASYEVYDLFDYSLLPAQPSFPRPARSLVARGTRVMVIDERGASLVDLATNTSAEISPPDGGSFGDVAGGITLRGGDDQYVVGGTRRTGEPTARVLRVGKDGALTFFTLATPRLGAGATWIDGRGLLVVLGSPTGAGAEFVGPGATSASALPYPARATTGGTGVTPIDANRVLVLAGGDTQPRVLDLSCSSACDFQPRGGALPLTLTDNEAYTLEASQQVLLGRDATADHVFVVGEIGAPREVPFKIGRRGARALRIFNGALLFVGGATTMESYAPVVTQ
jgi:hypothetical protein